MKQDNNRLIIKLKENNEVKRFKIPFLYGKDIILKNIHITNKHPGINTMGNLIKASGYYWDGFSKV